MSVHRRGVDIYGLRKKRRISTHRPVSRSRPRLCCQYGPNKIHLYQKHSSAMSASLSTLDAMLIPFLIDVMSLIDHQAPGRE